MPAPRDWADPFFAQAREDLKAAQAAYLAKIPSAFCMLMQMTFEKLAKAALARKHIQPPNSHHVASRLLQYLERTPGGTSLPGVLIAPVFAAVRDLENAQPAVVRAAMHAHGVPQYPQLEYPWEKSGDSRDRMAGPPSPDRAAGDRSAGSDRSAAPQARTRARSTVQHALPVTLAVYREASPGARPRARPPSRRRRTRAW